MSLIHVARKSIWSNVAKRGSACLAWTSLQLLQKHSFVLVCWAIYIITNQGLRKLCWCVVWSFNLLKICFSLSYCSSIFFFYSGTVYRQSPKYLKKFLYYYYFYYYLSCLSLQLFNAHNLYYFRGLITFVTISYTDLWIIV